MIEATAVTIALDDHDIGTARIRGRHREGNRNRGAAFSPAGWLRKSRGRLASDMTRPAEASLFNMARKRDLFHGNFQRVGEPDDADEDRHFITSLGRGLNVLACFRKGEALLGNHDIAERCNLPRSTVSRITYTLTKLGYLHYSETEGKYRLGTAVLALGAVMLTKMDIRGIARPLMQELAAFSGGSVGLGARDQRSIIYVEYCHGKNGLTRPADIGTRIAIATSAMGRAFLAATPAKERDAILADIRNLDQIAWPETKVAIDKALDDHRLIGCTCSFGDWQFGVNAIAVGFQPGGGLPAMSINVAGPDISLSQQFLIDEVRPRLTEVARRLTGAMDASE